MNRMWKKPSINGIYFFVKLHRMIDHKICAFAKILVRSGNPCEVPLEAQESSGAFTKKRSKEKI